MAKEQVTERVGLLDGDIIAYKAACINALGDMEDLELLCNAIVEEWMGRAQCQRRVLCLSKPSFRYEIFPEYKAHRKDVPKPDQHKEAIHFLRQQNTVVECDRMEADDVMGVLATNGKFDDPVIITIDKDLRCIPGWHCNPDKDQFPIHLDADEALINFCMQWMCGDSSDGYKGIPKCGPVKASKILAGDPTDPVRATLHAFYDAGFTYADALVQARLARILTSDLFDAATKAPRFWEPDQIPDDLTLWATGQTPTKLQLV